jgi:hypothetical protein
MCIKKKNCALVTNTLNINIEKTSIVKNRGTNKPKKKDILEKGNN